MLLGSCCTMCDPRGRDVQVGKSRLAQKWHDEHRTTSSSPRPLHFSFFASHNLIQAGSGNEYVLSFSFQYSKLLTVLSLLPPTINSKLGCYLIPRFLLPLFSYHKCTFHLYSVTASVRESSFYFPSPFSIRHPTRQDL
jgi:hypothetical protein